MPVRLPLGKPDRLKVQGRSLLARSSGRSERKNPPHQQGSAEPAWTSGSRCAANLLNPGIETFQRIIYVGVLDMFWR